MTGTVRDFVEFGYIRAAAIAPRVHIGNPLANADEIIAHLRALNGAGVSLAVFPELCLTGYSVEDMFLNNALISDTREALGRILAEQADIVAVVGAPWETRDTRLLNCALVLADGRIAGVTPKSAIANHGEFYEGRWFDSGRGLDLAEQTEYGGFRINTRQIFHIGEFRFGVELCEDLWSPRPPGANHALAGADLIVNLSASNELVAKADYRRNLIRMASGAWICGYLYAGAGARESSKDQVYGGHLLAAENGHILCESERFRLAGDGVLCAEFDVQKLRLDRLRSKTFSGALRPDDYHPVPVASAPQPLPDLARTIDPHPFVPGDLAEREERAEEILAIQSTGLCQRMLGAGIDHLVLGLSGGLDSSLALLVCLEALAVRNLDATHLHGLSLPGPGTSEHTRHTVSLLVQATGLAHKEIGISAAVEQHLADLGHETEDDLVFENAQARERTQILFDYANRVQGLVVGTGDLSELALGWCTFNADQMAGYNVNAGVPKTLVASLVRWYARRRAGPGLAEALERVLETPISPELLRAEAGAVRQKTEEIIGPYELHDFFLFHHVRHGSGPQKIFALARLAFAERYPASEIKRWLAIFYERFFSQQFKRSSAPPGPKVGSVSLSPRADWRMPDEMSAAAILAAVARIDT